MNYSDNSHFTGNQQNVPLFHVRHTTRSAHNLTQPVWAAGDNGFTDSFISSRPVVIQSCILSQWCHDAKLQCRDQAATAIHDQPQLSAQLCFSSDAIGHFITDLLSLYLIFSHQSFDYFCRCASFFYVPYNLVQHSLAVPHPFYVHGQRVYILFSGTHLYNRTISLIRYYSKLFLILIKIWQGCHAKQ